ncbi:hypothetical protein BUALT_Bualt12G0037300 [Buddleja alternifolia]|uniref:Leucine-rich repeat-containing N-terminal plant-type domain-containing protein n=1 Tax=Buddleja alternifolia TaxID=168488 RepID=A0AAV6WV65_9LAMI|nr:hypothetical protein BUALT_Bualt12G0037300 [Buddleja alternifolia]
MSLGTIHHFGIAIFIMFSSLIKGKFVSGDIDRDKEVLLNLKSYVQHQDPNYDKHHFNEWNSEDKSPCKWPGISCNSRGDHVTAIDLSNKNIMGNSFNNFSSLPELRYLYLSNNVIEGNKFSGKIPPEIGPLLTLESLLLGDNNFSRDIPKSLVGMSNLSLLDLSSNGFGGDVQEIFGRLHQTNMEIFQVSKFLISLSMSGSIPPTFGKLSSILWLMLANNSLTGEIPAESGNCGSLLWLNFANNQLSGTISPQLFNIGSNPMPQFLLNRMGNNAPVLGRCSTLKRWIPAEDFPFASFTLFSDDKCGQNWDILFNGCDFFSMCTFSSSPVRPVFVYIQLSGNKLSGEIPSVLRKLENLAMLYLDDNGFNGELPPEIGFLPLIALNISKNKFSGEIPREIGTLEFLRNLGLSYNNFSGDFPRSITYLPELSRFNISYNPFISGRIPSYGQLATFDGSSFLGNPFLELENGTRTTTSVSVPSCVHCVLSTLLLAAAGVGLSKWAAVEAQRNMFEGAQRNNVEGGRAGEMKLGLALEGSMGGLVVEETMWAAEEAHN